MVDDPLMVAVFHKFYGWIWSILITPHQINHIWLVVWLPSIWHVPIHIGNLIFPMDELHHFSEGFFPNHQPDIDGSCVMNVAYSLDHPWTIKLRVVSISCAQIFWRSAQDTAERLIPEKAVSHGKRFLLSFLPSKSTNQIHENPSFVGYTTMIYRSFPLENPWCVPICGCQMCRWSAMRFDGASWGMFINTGKRWTIFDFQESWVHWEYGCGGWFMWKFPSYTMEKSYRGNWYPNKMHLKCRFPEMGVPINTF